jgi:hypothetical protein
VEVGKKGQIYCKKDESVTVLRVSAGRGNFSQKYTFCSQSDNMFCFFQLGCNVNSMICAGRTMYFLTPRKIICLMAWPIGLSKKRD